VAGFGAAKGDRAFAQDLPEMTSVAPPVAITRPTVSKATAPRLQGRQKFGTPWENRKQVVPANQFGFSAPTPPPNALPPQIG